MTTIVANPGYPPTAGAAQACPGRATLVFNVVDWALHAPVPRGVVRLDLADGTSATGTADDDAVLHFFVDGLAGPVAFTARGRDPANGEEVTNRFNFPLAPGQTMKPAVRVGRAFQLRMHADLDRDGRVDDPVVDAAAWSYGPAGVGAILVPRTMPGADPSPRAPLELRWQGRAPESWDDWDATLSFDHPERLLVYAAAAGGEALAVDAPLSVAPARFAGADGVRRLWLEARAFPAASGEAAATVVATLRFRPPNGGPEQVQRLPFRLAPWLMASDLDPTAVVFARGARQGEAALPPMAQALADRVQGWAEFRPFTVAAGAADKGFMRDPMHAGYVVSPGRRQSVLLRGLDASPLEGVVAKLQQAQPQVGALAPAPGDLQGQDNGGNLLVTPPLPGFPFGRIVYGDQSGGGLCQAGPFFAAQGFQKPIVLDSTWLDVGHVDEVLSFVPDYSPGADAQRPFKVLVASPRLAFLLLWATARQLFFPRMDDARLEVLELQALPEAQEQRREKLRYDALVEKLRLDTRFAVRASTVVGDDVPAPFVYTDALVPQPATPQDADGKLVMMSEMNGLDHKLPRLWPKLKASSYRVRTPQNPAPLALSRPRRDANVELRKDVDRYLTDTAAEWKWMLDDLQPRLDDMRATLARELGVDDAAFVEIPTVMTRQEEGGKAFFDLPDPVNMLVLNKPAERRCRVVVPKPFGPLLDGEYVFERYVRKALEALRLDVVFLNDLPLTRLHGEIHCGTNQLHVPPDVAWWREAPL